MKTIITIITIFALLPGITLADNEDLPSDVKNLIKLRDKHIGEINSKFERAVWKLREKHRKAGRVEAVNAIDAMLEREVDKPVEDVDPIVGNWEFTISTGIYKPAPYTFLKDGTVKGVSLREQNPAHGTWERKGRKVIVYFSFYGAKPYAEITIDKDGDKCVWRTLPKPDKRYGVRKK